MLLIFEGGFGCDFGYPRAPSKVKKLDFHCHSKSRVDLFAPEGSRDQFWMPKWCRNGSPNQQKVIKKHTSQINQNIKRKVHENGRRMDPKWDPKLLENRTRCFNGFWVPQGDPRGDPRGRGYRHFSVWRRFLGPY